MSDVQVSHAVGSEMKAIVDVLAAVVKAAKEGSLLASAPQLIEAAVAAAAGYDQLVPDVKAASLPADCGYLVEQVLTALGVGAH
jgi:hypothetical protein